MVRPSTPSLLLQSVTPPVAGLSKKTRLSWDSLRPPADISLLASTPTASEDSVSAIGFHTDGHVLPLRFLTTSTAFSASEP